MKAAGVLSLTTMWRHLFPKLNNACLIKRNTVMLLGKNDHTRLLRPQMSDVFVSYLHLGSEYTSVIFTYIKNCYPPPGVGIHVYLESSES